MRQIRHTKSRHAYQLALENPTMSLSAIQRGADVCRNTASKMRQLARKDTGLPPRLEAPDTPSEKALEDAEFEGYKLARQPLAPPPAPEVSLPDPEDFAKRFQAPKTAPKRTKPRTVQTPPPAPPTPSKPKAVERHHRW